MRVKGGGEGKGQGRGGELRRCAHLEGEEDGCRVMVPGSVGLGLRLGFSWVGDVPGASERRVPEAVVRLVHGGM